MGLRHHSRYSRDIGDPTPGDPQNFTAYAASSTVFVLSWVTDVNRPLPTDFDLFFSIASDAGPWTGIPYDMGNTYNHTGQDVTVRHWWRLLAKNGGYFSNSVYTTALAHRPVFTVAPVVYVLGSSGGTIDFDATDVDGGLLTYSLAFSYRGDISINSSTGIVTVPSAAAGTNGNIIVRATDSIGLYSEASCAVTVQAVGGVAWPWPVQDSVSYLPIVPGGRGFGMDTLAGFGTTARGQAFNVYFIDSVGTGTDGGRSYGGVSNVAGTLRWCLAQAGPRVIIPATSGIVDYQIDGTNNPVYLNVPMKTTVAMQCAPSPGFHTSGGLWYTNGGQPDVLLWHVNSLSKANPLASTRGDCFRINANNTVHANCSAGWPWDEAWQLYEGPGTNITLWQCMGFETIAITPFDGLCNTLVANNYTNVSILRHIGINCFERNPMSKSPSCTIADAAFYNCGLINTQVGVGIQLQNESNVSTQTNVEETIAWDGPQGTNLAVEIYHRTGQSPAVDWNTASRAWINGTQVEPSSGISPLVNSAGGLFTAASARITGVYPRGYVPTTSLRTGGASLGDQTLLRLNSAGACPKYVNFVDTRRQYFRNWIAKNGGPYGGMVTSFPPVPTVAVNTVNHFAGADPIPYGTRNTVNGATGYTLLEEWLHRRHAEVMP